MRGVQRLRAHRGLFVCGVTDHSGCGPWSSSPPGGSWGELVSKQRELGLQGGAGVLLGSEADSELKTGRKDWHDSECVCV